MGTEDAIALPNSTLEPRTEAKQRLSSKSHQVSAKVTIPAKEEISSSDDDAHVPVTEIHLKSHEWFGDFITKHEIPRKVFHSSIGFITLYLYTQGINYKNVLWPLIYAFIILFILDLIRLNWPFFNMLYCRTVGALMRKRRFIHTMGYCGTFLG